MRNITFLIIGVLLVLSSCTKSDSFTTIQASGASLPSSQEKILDTINIVHYNIIIAPDLSNRVDDRLYPKPVFDAAIVQKILDNIFVNRSEANSRHYAQRLRYE